jgi:hypothetical protein
MVIVWGGGAHDQAQAGIAGAGVWTWSGPAGSDAVVRELQICRTAVVFVGPVRTVDAVTGVRTVRSLNPVRTVEKYCP